MEQYLWMEQREQYLCSPQCERETFLANNGIICLTRQPIFIHRYEKADVE